jgi:membrane fusion protein YbhG
VTADPFPGVIFPGTVTSVNTKAEYTPRNIQTQQDRLNLVFGVNVRVTSSGGLLKPGMPVDGAFVPTMP